MDITLVRIKNAFERLEYIDGEDAGVCLERAIEAVKDAQEALETISVKGRSNVDALLGCMMGLDMIIGKEE